MGRRISRLLAFKPKKISISISLPLPTLSLTKTRALSISLPQLDELYHPHRRDLTNTSQISIHGYLLPARLLSEPNTARFLDTLPIGEFKRLGRLVITASVGRLSHLSLLPDSDHLIIVAVTKLRLERGGVGVKMDNELRLRLIYCLVNRYGPYFRCLEMLYPGELEALVGSSHRCHPLAVL
ncbi:hypothetical protein TWF481_004229 [Arthrobotrys musiformis]|uniref:Uncharacterized protein n=1 Tax=Arthrobotrys musiformis TaxID=47236 RepID=A0AAV9WIY0_9PEZI